MLTRKGIGGDGKFIFSGFGRFDGRGRFGFDSFREAEVA